MEDNFNAAAFFSLARSIDFGERKMRCVNVQYRIEKCCTQGCAVWGV